MSNEFGKTIERQVTIYSRDPGLPDRTFVIEISEGGVRIRPFGKRSDEAKFLTWKSIIGHALIHLGE